MKKIVLFLVCAATFFVFAVTPVVEGEPGATKKTITILHTNDLHGRIESYFLLEDRRERGGMARLASVVDSIRQKEDNVILVDAGDTIHGTGLSDLHEGKSMISIMNAIGYQVMVAGNHDFHWRGAETILARSTEAAFPIISANTIQKDTRTPLLPPYVFIEQGGVRIAFLGLTTPGTPGTVGHKLVADLEFLDPVETAALYVPYLRERADLVVILSHLGGETEDKVAKTVAGIDVIVHGHTHARRSKTVNDTLIVAAGCWGFYMGYLRLTLSDGKIVGYEKRLIPITLDIKEDSQIASLVQSYRRPIANYLDEVVGYTTTDLIWGGWGDWIVTKQQTNLGYLIADVIRNVGKADVGLYNPWVIRDNIASGAVLMSDIHNVLPFDWHKIVVARLSGEAVRNMLEVGIILQSAGLIYEVDRNRPAGQQVTKVLIDGQPLEVRKTYTVAMSTNMWESGLRKGLFKEKNLVEDTGILVRDAVANHFRKVRTVDRGITKIKELPEPW